VNTYEVRVDGQLDRRWLEWFGAVSVARMDGGETILTFTAQDQEELSGVLGEMCDLGLTPISVRRVDPE
jgi:hypothetical protein